MNKKTKPYEREIKAKSENQQNVIDEIRRNVITFVTGPPGSGKSYLATAIGCRGLITGQYEKLIITRPIIEAGGNSIGFLPGDANTKVMPFMVPVLDECKQFCGNLYEKFITEKSIEIIPLQYMRGRNFHHSYIIADEFSNANMSEFKLLLTRIGQDSKMVINGDLRQSDLRREDQGAMELCINRLSAIPGIGYAELHYSDIVRHSIIAQILEALKDK